MNSVRESRLLITLNESDALKIAACFIKTGVFIVHHASRHNNERAFLPQDLELWAVEVQPKSEEFVKSDSENGIDLANPTRLVADV